MWLLEKDLEHVLHHTKTIWPQLQGSRIFLTGGTGFVGSWMLETLLYANTSLNLNINVWVLTRDPGRFREKEPHLTDNPAVRLLEGSVTDFPVPGGEFPFIIHAAFPETSITKEITAMERMLNFAGVHKTKRFLFTSSGVAYGTQPYDMYSLTEDYPGAPLTTDLRNPYAHSKRIAEVLCYLYGTKYEFAATVARLFAFSGPRLPLDKNFAIGNFIQNILQGSPIHVKGDGTTVRSYLYAADMAIWLWHLLMRAPLYRLYNVGSDDGVMMADLASMVVKVTGVDAEIKIAHSAEPGHPSSRYVPCVQRARQELDLDVWIPLEEGIHRMYEWYRA